MNEEKKQGVPSMCVCRTREKNDEKGPEQTRRENKRGRTGKEEGEKTA